jgi:hypothetical protein
MNWGYGIFGLWFVLFIAWAVYQNSRVHARRYHR